MCQVSQRTVQSFTRRVRNNKAGKRRKTTQKRRDSAVLMPSPDVGLYMKKSGGSLDLQIPPKPTTLPPTSDIPEPPLELRGSRAWCCEVASNDLRRKKQTLDAPFAAAKGIQSVRRSSIQAGNSSAEGSIRASDCLYQLMTIIKGFVRKGPSLFLLLVSDSFPLHNPVFPRLFPDFVCWEQEQSLNSLAGADWKSQGRLFTSLSRLCQSLHLSAGLPSFPLTLCLYMASLCLLSLPEMSLWLTPCVIVSATSLFCGKLARPPLFLWVHEEGGSFYYSPLR